MAKKIFAADLFCGAGGTSSGLAAACEKIGMPLKLVAINHWEIAIATHSENHPDAKHMCASVDSVDPRKVVPGGKLQILVASPECTHFSRARGGKPRNDQSRASAWLILRWLELLTVENVLIENVPDFVSYGPLGSNGKPLKRRKGEIFNAFIAALRAMNYTVDWKVLNCANYGDATTRERLFILARRGRKSINWPEPTHSADGARTLFGEMKRWRAAREIIDWGIPGHSIFDPKRKKPLSPNTMRRIVAGLRKFAGLRRFSGLPFILTNEGYVRGNVPRPVDNPVPTVTQRGAGALVQPFVLNVNGGNDGYLRCSSIDDPLPTITTQPATALVEPYIISLEHTTANGSQVRSVNQPVSTITGEGRIGLVEPYISTVNHGKDESRTYPVDKPMPTITSVDAWALIEPFIVMLNGTSEKAVQTSSRSVDDPLPTVVGSAPHLYLAEPFVIGQQSKAAPRSVSEPLPTVAGAGAIALVQPFLTKYYGTANGAQSVDEPLDTVSTKDRHALVEPYLVEYHGANRDGGERVRSVDKPLPTVATSNQFGLAEPRILPKECYGVPIVLPEGTQAILDIRFRMLQPHELAAAMSFPKDYKFSGKRRDVVKQIGNAVPTKTAEALCLALLNS